MGNKEGNMLNIKSITKTYKTEGFTQKALDKVSINFRRCEFTSILGPSGSGKTTLLNIIGGLDHYSRVFSSTTVQKHQFISTQPSSQSNSHIHT